MEYEIVYLPKEQWRNYIIPFRYTTQEYYDVAVHQKEAGFSVEIERKRFESPVTHTPDEYDFPDKLYEEWWENACAWGVLIEGELKAVIETDPEIWSNRLRVVELWVDEQYQKQGIGHALMEVANFTLIGMDTCCYKNNDLDRKEVRIEMGWFPDRKKAVAQ